MTKKAPDAIQARHRAATTWVRARNESRSGPAGRREDRCPPPKAPRGPTAPHPGPPPRGARRATGRGGARPAPPKPPPPPPPAIVGAGATLYGRAGIGEATAWPLEPPRQGPVAQWLEPAAH